MPVQVNPLSGKAKYAEQHSRMQCLPLFLVADLTHVQQHTVGYTLLHPPLCSVLSSAQVADLCTWMISSSDVGGSRSGVKHRSCWKQRGSRARAS